MESKENKERKVIGYVRVSTEKQEGDRQESDILKYVNMKKLGTVDFVSEIKSSRKTDREIYSLIDRLGKGDTIIITELSRIGRSMKDINFIISKLREKEIDIHVITNDMVISEKGDTRQILTTEILLFALGLSAEIERDLISERTKSALRERKKRGVILGRPKGKGQKLAKYFEANPLEKEKYIMLREAGLSYSKISQALGMSQVQVAQYFDSLKSGKKIRSSKK